IEQLCAETRANFILHFLVETDQVPRGLIGVEYHRRNQQLQCFCETRFSGGDSSRDSQDRHGSLASQVISGKAVLRAMAPRELPLARWARPLLLFPPRRKSAGPRD